MTVRENSIEVYHDIDSEGLLGKMQRQVLETLIKTGPATANQLFLTMRGTTNTNQANVRARLSELREMGCAKDLGYVPCPTNGRRVILWGPLNQKPKRVERAESYARRLLREVHVNVSSAFLGAELSEKIANYLKRGKK
jgi:hypothetical protein